MKKSIPKTKKRTSIISLLAVVILLAGMAVAVGLVLEQQGLISFAKKRSECSEDGDCEKEKNERCQINKKDVGTCVRLKKNECETDLDCKKQALICQENNKGRKSCVKAARNEKEEIDWKANGRCLPANNPDKRCNRKRIGEGCRYSLFSLGVVAQCAWMDEMGSINEERVSGCVCGGG